MRKSFHAWRSLFQTDWPAVVGVGGLGYKVSCFSFLLFPGVCYVYLCVGTLQEKKLMVFGASPIQRLCGFCGRTWLCMSTMRDSIVQPKSTGDFVSKPCSAFCRQSTQVPLSRPFGSYRSFFHSSIVPLLPTNTAPCQVFVEVIQCDCTNKR